MDQPVVSLTHRCMCGGTYLPSPDVHFDADGSATVGLYCDQEDCLSESVAYFTWDAPE